MELFATYCSADKEAASGDLPAVERYVSERISGAYANALSSGNRFAILSGRFGLIAPDTPIPHYDHLLQVNEMDAMVQRVTTTLKAWEVTTIRWFTVAFEMDPNVTRYRDVMSQSATQIGAEFEIELWEPTGMLGLI